MKYFTLTVFFVLFSISSWGSESVNREVFFEWPINGDEIITPERVCVGTIGVEVEPASNGINPNKGHHHILVDIDFPADMSKPIPMGKNHFHLGDGSDCKNISLSSGKHTLRLIFANGDHIPIESVAMDMIEVTVEQ